MGVRRWKDRPGTGSQLGLFERRRAVRPRKVARAQTVRSVDVDRMTLMDALNLARG
jgi:hypothetical protein